MLFLLFLISDLHFLISAAIADIFNPIAKLVIPIGIRSEEVKFEIKIHPVVIVEGKIRKCLIQFRVVQTFLPFLFINSFCFISSK